MIGGACVPAYPLLRPRISTLVSLPPPRDIFADLYIKINILFHLSYANETFNVLEDQFDFLVSFKSIDISKKVSL